MDSNRRPRSFQLADHLILVLLSFFPFLIRILLSLQWRNPLMFGGKLYALANSTLLQWLTNPNVQHILEHSYNNTQLWLNNPSAWHALDESTPIFFFLNVQRSHAQ